MYLFTYKKVIYAGPIFFHFVLLNQVDFLTTFPGNLISPVQELQQLALQEYSSDQGLWKSDIKLIQKM